MGLLGSAPPTAGVDSGRLFAAGVTYICCGAWTLAYDCFVRSAHEDAPTRYNQALCCFMTRWYEECHRLLAEAERLLGHRFRAAVQETPATAETACGEKPGISGRNNE